MRLYEFESVDMNKLDDHLAKLCSMVKRGQEERPDYYGMVAAGIVTPKGKFVAKLNYPKGKLRVHAERAVIEEYQKYHGKIPEGSVMVTTLSPCNETDDETAEGRVGMSCTDLINHHGFKHVYCGYKDPTQDADHGEYKEVITKNKQLRNMCKQFADTFLDKLDEVQFGGQDVEGNPLEQLKEKFPNLSTLLYFIPGLSHALLVADVISQVQMYNQAMDKIEKQYPKQTIQAVQQKVGDAGEKWETLKENFADGRNPQDKGDSARYGIPKHASISTLRKIAHQGGRKGQLAHWQANMRAGHKK
jgi:pyrimidine deaminase RibD-like protein